VRRIDTRQSGERRDDGVDRLYEPAAAGVPAVDSVDEPGRTEAPQGPGRRPRRETEMIGDHPHARPGKPAVLAGAGVEADVHQDGPRGGTELPHEGARGRRIDQSRRPSGRRVRRHENRRRRRRRGVPNCGVARRSAGRAAGKGAHRERRARRRASARCRARQQPRTPSGRAACRCARSHLTDRDPW